MVVVVIVANFTHRQSHIKREKEGEKKNKESAEKI